MTSKTLSFSSRRSSHPNDDDVVWPAPMAGGPPPPVRTESEADIERVPAAFLLVGVKLEQAQG